MLNILVDVNQTFVIKINTVSIGQIFSFKISHFPIALLCVEIYPQCSHNQILIFLSASSKIPQIFSKFLKVPNKALNQYKSCFYYFSPFQVAPFDLYYATDDK